MASAPESVGIRQRGSYDFETHYCSLCALQDTVPLLEVKGHLSQGVLDINADKIRLVDWTPILSAFRINKNLRFVAVRCFYSQSLEKDDSKKSHYFKRRPPAIQSKDMTLRLAQTISECLKHTESLKCLDLQGVTFRRKDLAVLSKGLERNSTLTHLSLGYCQIRDDGCELMCDALKHHPSLTHLNFTGCSLTRSSAEVVAKLIKHQSTERHSEAWVDSLRYRQPNLNSMTGLRRITINHNPMLGDEGTCLLADALKDDLWLKAIDLQKCGIGRDGANALLETLRENRTLLVADVRFNPLIDRGLLHSVIGQVLINSNGYDDKEFPWIKSDPPKDPYRTRPRRRGRQISSRYGRKITTRQAQKSTRQMSPGQVNPGTEGFVPWRTAYRASQHRRAYVDEEHIGTPRYLQNAEVHEASIHVDEETATSSEEEEVEERTPVKTRPIRQASPSPTRASKSYTEVIRELKIDLLEARRTVAEERKARHMAEQHATNLEVENVRLRKELEDKGEINRIRSMLDDEGLLESIENSFNKFHDFLDLLKQLGLGGLAAYAGLSSMDFPLGTAKDNQKQHSNERIREDSVRDESGSQRPIMNSQSSSQNSHDQVDSIVQEDEEFVLAPPPITIHSQQGSGDANSRNQAKQPKSNHRSPGAEGDGDLVSKRSDLQPSGSDGNESDS